MLYQLVHIWGLKEDPVSIGPAYRVEVGPERVVHSQLAEKRVDLGQPEQVKGLQVREGVEEQLKREAEEGRRACGREGEDRNGGQERVRERKKVRFRRVQMHRVMEWDRKEGWNGIGRRGGMG